MIRAAALALALAACATPPTRFEALPLEGFDDAINHWHNRHGDEYAVYAPTQVREIAENLLLYQRDNGGWVENRDPTRILSAEEAGVIVGEKAAPGYSFDNRNIYTQVTYLMGAYERIGDARYRAGAERGLDLVMAAQMPACGGWPHSVPATNEYHGRLTIADEVMSGNLRLLRDVSSRAFPFASIGAEQRARATQALARGERCLLDLQICQNGRLAGWAGQYDPATRQPLGGRRFELPAVVSQESAEIVRYLMSIPDPSPEVIASIEGAVAWFERSRIDGQLLVETPLPEPVRYDFHTATFDRRLVPDPAAPPLWARFYDLADNSVILANRDGTRVATYAEIHPERRTGYSWYGEWPANLLARYYPAWRQRVGR